MFIFLWIENEANGDPKAKVQTFFIIINFPLKYHSLLLLNYTKNSSEKTIIKVKYRDLEKST